MCPDSLTRVTADDSVSVVTTTSELERVAQRAAGAAMLAVDVEGNGLFVYRAQLCTVQLGWLEQGGAMHIAIVDTLACDPGPLAPLLGAQGPVKVLHDFTFDAKLLQEVGVALANVRDTSVLARLLGRKATGLGSLLASELGIVVPKDLQQHDWSKRPLTEPQLAYLAADVRHLGALYDRLNGEAVEREISEEVEEESQYKLETALAPQRDRGPSYLRIKGADKLDPLGLAVLRRLVAQRELLAADWDVPPFKVAGNDLLLELSRARPTSREALRTFRRGFSSRLAGSADRLLAAILQGLQDETVPAEDRAEPARLDRTAAALRRGREKRLTAFRRSEAARRGVDEQVVLPGHCLQDALSLDQFTLQALAGVKGLGQKRLALYGEAILGAMAEPALIAPTAVAEPPP